MIKELHDLNEKKLRDMNPDEIIKLKSILERIKETDFSSVSELSELIKQSKEILKKNQDIDSWFKSFKEEIEKISKILKSLEENFDNFGIKSSISGTLNFWYLDRNKKTKIKQFSSREGLLIIKKQFAIKNKINPKKTVNDIIFSSSMGFQIVLRQITQGSNERNFSLRAVKFQDDSDLVFSKKNLGMFVKTSLLDENYDLNQGSEILPNNNYYVYAKAIKRKGKHGLITIFRVFKN